MATHRPPICAEVSEEDSAYMRRALELAARATGETFPNPLVGCVIVKDGEVRSVLHKTQALYDSRRAL